MRVLFIGGTGNISAAVARLAVGRGIEVWVLNRGRREGEGIVGARSLRADIVDRAAVAAALAGQVWDAVVNFIAYVPADVERDVALFAGKTRQYVFISSAACYQKPPVRAVVTEATPLCNPYWQYAQDKIACEERLMRAHREAGFPVTIVRPSHTYDTMIPTALSTGWGLIDRMKRGLPIVVHGDGTSLWTMTHAEDFAKGLVGLLGREEAMGEAVHITSDESLTWNQIYMAMGRAVGVEARLVHVATDFIVGVEPSKRGPLVGDKMHSVIFDNTKIKRLVPGYVATVPFEEGIGRTVAWFEAEAGRRKVDGEAVGVQERILGAYGGVSGG